jgi:hypothetical protein
MQYFVASILFIYFFICSVFKDPFSATQTIYRRMKVWWVNDEMERMFEGSCRGKFKALSLHLPGIVRKNMKDLSRNSQSPDRESTSSICDVKWVLKRDVYCSYATRRFNVSCKVSVPIFLRTSSRSPNNGSSVSVRRMLNIYLTGRQTKIQRSFQIAYSLSANSRTFRLIGLLQQNGPSPAISSNLIK